MITLLPSLNKLPRLFLLSKKLICNKTSKLETWCIYDLYLYFGLIELLS